MRVHANIFMMREKERELLFTNVNNNNDIQNNDIYVVQFV